MRTFKVTITETLKKEVEVEASSLDEAEGIAEDDWNHERHVLDPSHFFGVSFSAAPIRRERPYER
jgi:hypothetical protein